MNPGLFRWGQFVGNSGLVLPFKIDCDTLEQEDWTCLARLTAERVGSFGEVEGVPRGGLPFQEALLPLRGNGPLLIVDDVCTTGGSLERHRAGRTAVGVVVFARGPTPPWVTPLFTWTGD